MPVFLRWLLVEMIARRIFQHPRVRNQINTRVMPMVSQYRQPGGWRQPSRFARGAGFVRRRPRLGCCSGCLAMVAIMVLLFWLIGLLMHWVL